MTTFVDTLRGEVSHQDFQKRDSLNQGHRFRCAGYDSSQPSAQSARENIACIVNFAGTVLAR